MTILEPQRRFACRKHLRPMPATLRLTTPTSRPFQGVAVKIQERAATIQVDVDVRLVLVLPPFVEMPRTVPVDCTTARILIADDENSRSSSSNVH